MHTGQALKNALTAAEATGLHTSRFDPSLQSYLPIARAASNHGYEVTFFVVAAPALSAAAIVGWLVRRPSPAGPPPEPARSAPGSS